MKIIFIAFLFSLALNANADTFILKDGARLEGEVTGEMDGVVLVQTRYGSLSIKRTDIQEQKTILPAVAPAISAQVAAALSTAAAVAVSTAQPAPAEQYAPRFTFATVLPSTSTRLLVYSENGVAIATETLDAAGARVSMEGAIKNGTYTEYYDNGGLNTVKTMSGGKANGTLRAYYRSGTVQIEAYYLAGAKEGPFNYYAENGKLLMEAGYKNDRLSGWKKEYDETGAVKSEAFYADDHLAEPPKPPAEVEQPKDLESPGVTVKVVNLARGERFTFQLNGKYAARATLDKDFNIISLEGELPDGTVKVYSKDGKQQKEFVFEKSDIKTLRIYEPGGPLKAEYIFLDNKAIKKQ